MVVESGEKLCNTLPPVEVDYTAKGRWLEGDEMLNGCKTYFSSTGPTTKALIYIYDIGGLCSQNYQGADILANAGYDVYVVDVMRGGNLDLPKFMEMSSEDKIKVRETFDKGSGNLSQHAAEMPSYINLLRAKGYTRVGAAGFCWGGNLVVQVPEFDVIAMIHPGRQVNAKAAERLNVPTCLLPSQNDPEELMEGFHAVMKTKPFGEKCILKWYKDQIHGFCAARGDLSDLHVRAGFQDVFVTLIKFFKDNL
ncbi:hypothetical protein M231_01969 [Tremella mesenterica]|uniref:Dienelactone hydrolase domain-containing protein n=1 Tax=Tremella mesenterica TaxID=5217 RepID=A0A4V1M4K8_TREME|nr:hypothetical protein M231_01969 [Tremella mesenterica]